MSRLSRGWALVGASWCVLMSDRGLLLFPVLGLLTSAVASVVLVAPLWLTGPVERAVAGVQREVATPELLLGLFLLYFGTSFCTLFFNTALAAVVLGRLRGERTSLGEGLSLACTRLPGLLAYAAISATVGVLLRLLSDRNNLLGQIVASVLGAAWSVMTFLVVPVLVAEDCDPITAIKRSVALLKQTWGEQVTGHLGMGLVFGLLALPVLLPFVLLHGQPALLLPLFLVGGLYLLGLFVVSTALGQVFRTAVYVYAATGEVPSQFEPWTLRDAFRRQ